MDALAYRPAEAAKAVGLSRSLLFQLLRAGDIHAFKVGAATLISAEELRAWVSRQAAGESSRTDG